MRKKFVIVVECEESERDLLVNELLDFVTLDKVSDFSLKGILSEQELIVKTDAAIYSRLHDGTLTKGLVKTMLKI